MVTETSPPGSSSWDFSFGQELHRNRAQGLAFQFRYDGNGRERFLHGGIHKKPPIRRHDVLSAWRSLPRTPKVSDKQRSGGTGFNELTVRNKADRNSNQPAIGRDVETIPYHRGAIAQNNGA
jgi:hypothetical protein